MWCAVRLRAATPPRSPVRLDRIYVRGFEVVGCAAWRFAHVRHAALSAE